MEITYHTTRSDLWRCYLYTLSRRSFSAGLILLFMLLFAFRFSHTFQHFGKWGFVFLLFVDFASFFAYFALILRMQIHRKLPAVNTERICTTTLLPSCLRDVTPEKSADIPWARVRDVRQHQGDIYFWVGLEGGNFVPRTAFQNPQQAQQFLDTAYALWQAAKSGHPLPEIKEGEVWPPPPRMGA